MRQQIVDRRLSGKNKSVGNRERFLRRHKAQIRDAVRRAVDCRGIRDIEQAEEVTIPRKDLSQPIFHHDQGGRREVVHPGNRKYIQGDRVSAFKRIKHLIFVHMLWKFPKDYFFYSYYYLDLR